MVSGPNLPFGDEWSGQTDVRVGKGSYIDDIRILMKSLKCGMNFVNGN